MRRVGSSIQGKIGGAEVSLTEIVKEGGKFKSSYEGSVVGEAGERKLESKQTEGLMDTLSAILAVVDWYRHDVSTAVEAAGVSSPGR